MVNVRKRGNSYQYYFEIAPVDGKRKQKVKSGFKTKTEAYKDYHHFLQHKGGKNRVFYELKTY